MGFTKVRMEENIFALVNHIYLKGDKNQSLPLVGKINAFI